MVFVCVNDNHYEKKDLLTLLVNNIEVIVIDKPISIVNISFFSSKIFSYKLSFGLSEIMYTLTRRNRDKLLTSNLIFVQQMTLRQ